jgi:hypothetical protein
MVDTGLANLRLKQQQKKQSKQQQATPTTQGTRIPTTATVTIGDAQVVRSRQQLDSNGLRYITGIEADYGLTFYDQYGKVMGPDSGIQVQETVTQTGGETQTAVQNPDPVGPDSKGVFHDGFGPVWVSRAALPPKTANGIIMGMIDTPNGPLEAEQRLVITVKGIRVGTAVSRRTFSNVENGKVRSSATSVGGMTNNYVFTSTEVKITPTRRRKKP